MSREMECFCAAALPHRHCTACRGAAVGSSRRANGGGVLGGRAARAPAGGEVEAVPSTEVELGGGA